MLCLSMHAIFPLVIFMHNITQLCKHSLTKVEKTINLEIISAQSFQSVSKLLQRKSALKTVDRNDNMIEIDGSILEGGGQIIRNALSLSALTRTPIKIYNIRAGRDRPGLMEQHLKGLELIQAITSGHTQGATKGSTTVEFHPGAIQAGHFKSIVKTAGSISLLLQVALPCCIFAPAETYLLLEGGTNADMAPQMDYITEVFRPNLEKMGATFNFDLVKRGYFPRGGGRVELTIQPVAVELQPIVMEDMGNITAIYGWSFATGRMQLEEAEEMAKAAEETLNSFKVKLEIEVYREDKKIAPIGDCAGIILVAETSSGCILGGSGLRNRSNTSTDVGKYAAEELAGPLRRRVCVDDHCQDQLIIFMALAKGKSRIKVGSITMHTKTAIHIAELLTKAKFKIEDFSEYSIIECEGIGYRQQA